MSVPLFVTLPKNDFLYIHGADTITFLQGQVTCDMQTLTESTMLHGALCNIQGRVIADFHAVQYKQGCLLSLSQGLGDKVKAVLGKYAVFSKVSIDLLETEVTRQGLLGNDSKTLAESVLACTFSKDDPVVSANNKQSIAIALDNDFQRIEIWHLTEQLATNTNSALNNASNQASAEHWLAEDIVNGIVHVDTNSSENYTPQLLNYDHSGAINFKKGCYTGQEIVARMYYRSKAKKRLALIQVDDSTSETVAASTAISSDSRIVDDAGKNLDDGVLCWAYHQGRSQRLLLAVVPVLDDMRENTKPVSLDSWHIDTAPKLALTALPLPYF